MNEIKALIAAQQTELNSVIMYKALAGKMKDEKYKALLLKIAADEGRHAAILKKITGEELKPNNSLANMVCFFIKVMGRKPLFFIMSKIETAAFKTYEPYFEKYPQIKEIADDEIRHGKLLLGK